MSVLPRNITRIAVRPAVVLEEGRPGVAKAIHEKTGLRPIELDAGDPEIIDRVQKALDFAIEGRGRIKGHRGGLGQAVVVNGRLNPETRSVLNDTLETHYGVTPVHRNPRHDASVVAEKIVRATTVPRMTRRQQHQLARGILDAPTFSDACRHIMEEFHLRVVQAGKPNAPHQGSTSIARRTTARPFTPDFVLLPPDALGQPALAYTHEIGPEKDITHLLPQVPLEDTPTRSPYRVARVFRGEQGNRDAKGNPAHSHDANLHKDPNRFPEIDRRLGRAPFTEFGIHLGGRRGNSIALLHAYSRHKVPAVASREFARVMDRPAVRKALYDAWHSGEKDKTSLAAHANLVANMEAQNPYAIGHSTRVARIALALAAELNKKQKEKGRPPAFSHSDLEAVAWAGLLHDVGKTQAKANPRETDLYDEGEPALQEFQKHAQTALNWPPPRPGSLSAIVLVAATHPHGTPGAPEKERRIAELVHAASEYDRIMAPRADTREAIFLPRGGRVLGVRRGKIFSHETAVDHLRYLAREGRVKKEFVSALEALHPDTVRGVYADYKPRDYLLHWENEEDSELPPWDQPQARLFIPITREEEKKYG
ncbi:HD domain-containing protein [Candidatus Micrarchaeota archaeon]|nr:HD domain-containing protein [Candidatus Micrarchaeota archaeon]